MEGHQGWQLASLSTPGCLREPQRFVSPSVVAISRSALKVTANWRRGDCAAWLSYVGRSKKAVKVKPTPIIWRKRGQYLLTCSGSVLPDPVRFSSPVRPRKPQNTTMAEANLASLMIRDVKWARCPFRRYATPQATPKVKMIVPRPLNTLFRTICEVGAIWEMASRQSSSVISPEGLASRNC